MTAVSTAGLLFYKTIYEQPELESEMVYLPRDFRSGESLEMSVRKLNLYGGGKMGLLPKKDNLPWMWEEKDKSKGERGGWDHCT